MPTKPTVRVHHEGAPETPSASMARAANETASEVDARGRTIKVRSLKALETYRLTKMLGASSGIEAAFNFAFIAASVCEIDGEAVHFPVSEREIEFTIQRLENDGLGAVTEALKKLRGDGDVESDIAAAKN